MVIFILIWTEYRLTKGFPSSWSHKHRHHKWHDKKYDIAGLQGSGGYETTVNQTYMKGGSRDGLLNNGIAHKLETKLDTNTKEGRIPSYSYSQKDSKVMDKSLNLKSSIFAFPGKQLIPSTESDGGDNKGKIRMQSSKETMHHYQSPNVDRFTTVPNMAQSLTDNYGLLSTSSSPTKADNNLISKHRQSRFGKDTNFHESLVDTKTIGKRSFLDDGYITDDSMEEALQYSEEIPFLKSHDINRDKIYGYDDFPGDATENNVDSDYYLKRTGRAKHESMNKDESTRFINNWSTEMVKDESYDQMQEQYPKYINVEYVVGQEVEKEVLEHTVHFLRGKLVKCLQKGRQSKREKVGLLTKFRNKYCNSTYMYMNRESPSVKRNYKKGIMIIANSSTPKV
jgi:hypothetical protein